MEISYFERYFCLHILGMQVALGPKVQNLEQIRQSGLWT